MDFLPHQVLPGVFHIEDPIGGVHMTLLVGRKRALLFDAGYGAVDVRDYIRTLTKLPLSLVLSHGHHDHALGAVWFEEAFMDPLDLPVLQAYTGLIQRRRVILRARMPEARAQAFRQAPLPQLLPLPDTPFDLGGLTAQPLRVPGHTPGSIALLVRELRLLLLGDSWNPQTWLFFPEALPVDSYAASFVQLMDQPFDLALAPHLAAPVKRESLLAYCAGLTENGFAVAKPFVVPGHERVPTLAMSPAPGMLLIFRQP